MKEGEAVTFKSIDSAIEEFGNMALPPQHYNTQTPSGMPPHELTLKEGCIVILLRNLDVSLGLCNGTRLRVDKIKKDENVSISIAQSTFLLGPSLHSTDSRSYSELYGTGLRGESSDSDAAPSSAGG